MSTSSMIDLDLASTAANEAADVACKILRNYFGKVKNVSRKEGSSLVSEADKESESAIRSVLQKYFDNPAILGEEEGRSGQASGPVWMIDPLDGTHNYVCGFPIFCVSIGLQIGTESVLGLIDAPLLDQRFFAAQGRGATLNGRPMKVSDAPSIREILVATGFSYQKGLGLDRQMENLKRILNLSLGVRRPGAAAYDMAMVAAGVFGGFWEKGISPWDTCAGTCLIREAGGIVTDWKGAPYNPGSPQYETVVAGSPIMHAELLREILATE